MKNLRLPALISFFLLIFLTNIKAQVSYLRAELTDDSKVKLTWDNTDVFNDNFNIEKRTSKTGNWELIGDNITGGSFTDINTQIEEIYYYRFKNGNVIKSEINVGFELPRVDYRGRLMLIVEESLTLTLQDKIDQWILNAEGDGWTVLQKNIAKSASVVDIKDIIRQEYSSQNGLKSIFIFGDIAVPYSGSTAYDGHSNHVGAWPTDGFFADMDEYWSDHIVNVDINNIRLQNVPGDGKYDNNTIDDAEIEIGRVDLANMSLFPESELELLEKYLDKNNDFKTRKIIPKLQAFSRDNFWGTSGKEPSRYFPNLVGLENFKTGSFRNELTSDSYLIAYGAGGGTYTSAGGISTSQNMVTDSVQTIFTTSWGSYFGDWDNDNNYLRAHLCSGTVLTSNWDITNFNNMALGNTIGYDLKEYHSNLVSRQIITLLGDPTLRMQMGNPVDQVTLEMEDENVEISWEYNSEDIDRIIQFNIYRKAMSDDRFELITQVPNTSFSYIDAELTESDKVRYMVRAEYLETTPSGSYFNQGIGTHMDIDVPFVDLDNDGFDSYQDCNDQIAAINPSAQEDPNNLVDDNCNGIIDEQDEDQDGFFDYEDCNDIATEINPAAEEIINNGVDENCDGLDDLASECYAYSGIPKTLFFGAVDFYHQVTICDSLDDLPIDQEIKPNDAFAFDGENGRSYTFSFCEGYDEDIWKAVILIFPYNYNTGEIGELQEYKEDCQVTFTIDSISTTPDYLIVIKNKLNCHLESIDLTPNGFLNYSCAYIDADEDGYYDYEECDDNNAAVNPSQVEIPFNLLDDDCNENTLDNDGDQDGYPVTNDCDDNDPNINPSAFEIPGNMIDDNCNGLVDEIDSDGDGFPEEIDCDDTNASINPDAYDYANNGIDEDCDGIEVEVDSCLYYFWGPYDDFGDVEDFCRDEPYNSGYKAGVGLSYMVKNLNPNTSYVFSFCEDFDFSVWSPLITIVQYSVTTEEKGLIINGRADCEIDFVFPYDPDFPDIIVIVNRSDDCMSASSPQSLSNYIFYCNKIDADNDGYFAYEDCDDDNPMINPMATEICDNIDNNCDGYIDENLAILTYYLDADSDGFGDANNTLEACSLPMNYALDAGDCDDNNLGINPNAEEIPNNGIDEDCDGNDLISSIHEFSNAILTIYPNPASNVINIDINTNKSFEVRLFDSRGNLILIDRNIDNIDVKDFTSGIYLLIINSLESKQQIIERIFIY